MKVIKKYFILIVVLIYVMFMNTSIVNSYTAHTADEAINWVKSKLGQSIDYDGKYGAQCVDLIYAYYNYLGVPVVYGNGGDFSWNELPIGWNRYQGVQPQKGDILVYTDNSYGHVAIYESDRVTYHQNLDYIKYVRQPGYSYNGLNSPYWGVVRPDFKNDTQAPVINEFFADPLSMKSDSFVLKVKASDNVGVTQVKFGVVSITWSSDKSDVNEDDQLSFYNATYNSNTGYWEYIVKASEHNNEKGIYASEVYVYDAAGNSSFSAMGGGVQMGSTIANDLENSFYARIALNTDRAKVIGIDGTNSKTNVSLKDKNLNDNTQIWKFEKQSDGTYYIKNYATDLYIDINNSEDNDEANVLQNTYTGSNSQKYYVMNYNGGYRFQPKHSQKGRGLDANNNNIYLYQAWWVKDRRYEQTYNIEKVATNLELINLGNSELKVGEKTTLKAEITPTNVTIKTVKYTSSDENIATVDNNGVVTAKGVGNVIISANTIDGTNIEKEINIIVTKKNTGIFNDVTEDAWYYSAVKYVYENNIIKGYTNGNFGPNDNLTRAMLVTILHRMEKEPSVTTSNNFPDVGNTWYTNAINWASDKKIVMGYGDGTFKPNNNITRQDLMVILYRYAKYKGKNISTDADITNYPDYNKIDNYAKEAMKWAIGKKILYGNNSGLLDPKGNATRAQVAVIIERYMKNI